MDQHIYPIQVFNTIKMFGQDESLMLISAFIVKQQEGIENNHTMINWGVDKEINNKRITQGDMTFMSYDIKEDQDKLFVATKLCAMMEMPQSGYTDIALKVYKRDDDKVIFISMHPETLTIDAEGWDIVYDKIVKFGKAEMFITPKLEYYIKDNENRTNIRFPKEFYPLICMDRTTNAFIGDYGEMDTIISTVENIQAGAVNKSRTYIL